MSEQEKLDLPQDVMFSFIGTILGGALGVLQSWYDSRIIPKIIDKIREGEKINNFSDFTLLSGQLAGYLYGAYGIVKNILNEPNDWKSYIPVMTNTLFATGITLYNLGKDRGIKQARGPEPGSLEERINESIEKINEPVKSKNRCTTTP